MIRVSDETLESIQRYAEEKGLGKYEAAEALISVGDRRRAAWRRYQPKKAGRVKATR